MIVASSRTVAHNVTRHTLRWMLKGQSPLESLFLEIDGSGPRTAGEAVNATVWSEGPWGDRPGVGVPEDRWLGSQLERSTRSGKERDGGPDAK